MTAESLVERQTKELPVKLRRLVAVKRVLSDPIRNVIVRIPGGSERVFATLSASTDDAEAQTIARIWTTMAGGVYNRLLQRIDFADLCERADITPRAFIGIVYRCLWDMGEITGKAIYAAMYPQLMEASMLRALEPDATREREMHLQASGHVPTSKGIQIGIRNVNQQTEHDPEPGEASSVGRTARQAVRSLPE